MRRRFNTTGPCEPDRHYMIPAERRLPEAEGLVEQMGYFVVHAPRQTGKTTALRGLLVIFDRRQTAEDIELRTRFEEAVTPSGRPITVLRA